MRNRVSSGEYLAFLSTKYEVEPDRLFNALVSAEKNEESNCGGLSIRCRSNNHSKVVILITKGSKVVAQFPISKELLLQQENPIKAFIGTSLAGRYVNRKPINPPSLRIKDLKVGMKKINLKARILEIPEPKVIFTRFGNYASVSNALITDETGTIKLCLWNDQISSVTAGDYVQIENARVSVFRGESQLVIGRNGRLGKMDEPVFLAKRVNG